MTPLEHAQRFVGIKEVGENLGPPWLLFMPHSRDNKTPEKGLPWCAGFVLRCFALGGRRIHRNVAEEYAFCRVATMWEAMQQREWVILHEHAAPGDAIFFGSRVGSDAGPGNHVGIVERIDDVGIHTIEGNSGDAVARRVYAPTNSSIMGYARVPDAG